MKKATNIPGYALIAIVLIIFGYSCIDDNFEFNKLSTHVENEGEWIFPSLINTTYTIEDLLGLIDSSSYIGTDPNDEGLIMIAYSDSIETGAAIDSIQIPDQTYGETFTKTDFDAAGGFTGNTVTMFKGMVNYAFDIAGAVGILDSMTIASTDLYVNVTSSLEHTGSLDIVFPRVVKNNIPFSMTIPIDQAGNFSTTIHEIPEDYTLIFDPGTAVGDTNFFFITYTLNLNDGGSGTVDENNQLDVDILFQNLEYEFVFGEIGTEGYDIPAQQMNLDFFESFREYGNFHLADPRFRLNIRNSFGIPVAVYTTLLQFKINDIWENVEGDGIPTLESPWVVPLPILNYPYSIIPADTTFEIRGLTSNFDDLISQLPQEFRMQGAVEISPDEGSEFNWFSTESTVEASFEIEIPLHLSADSLVYKHVMDFNVSDSYESIDMVDEIILNLSIANGLPHSIKFQGTFYDSNLDTIDQIFYTEEDQWIILSGVIGADGRIDQETGKTEATTSISFTQERVNMLDSVKYLEVRFLYQTTNGGQEDVKYYVDYGMDFNVGAEIKLDLNEDL